MGPLEKMSAPGLHPLSPGDFAHRAPTITELDVTWFRTHSIRRSPIFFGRTGGSRFDSADDSYGLLYVGQDAYGAFIETFGQSTGTNAVTTTALAERALAELKPNRSLRLVNLTVSGELARIGADARLYAGDHRIAQQWSRAFHDHPSKPDGILYPARPWAKSVCHF